MGDIYVYTHHWDMTAVMHEQILETLLISWTFLNALYSYEVMSDNQRMQEGI